MPAKDSQISINQRSCIHAWREGKSTSYFIDLQDYHVFVSYLKDYFCDKNKSEDSKKIFTIRGKTYKGIPYQTQNFFSQIQLLAYKLEPNRIDLLLNEIVPEASEKFIRAISTRYAIYFNKKNNRTGSLFRDPYNLQKVTAQEISQVIDNLHSNFSKKDGLPNHYFSSYPEYLGQRITEWINYKEFLSMGGVENQESIHQETKPNIINNTQTPTVKPKPRIPEIIFAILILFLFSSFSISNIINSNIKSKGLINPLPSPHPQVSGIKDVKPLSPSQDPSLNQEFGITEANEEKEIKTVVIKITDGSEIVDLRKLPTIESEIVSYAEEGEEFELVASYPQWYEIRLEDGQNAFVPEKYLEIEI